MADGPEKDKIVNDLAASFQRALVDHLISRLVNIIIIGKGCSDFDAGSIKHLAVSGGVAANQYLRSRLEDTIEKLNLARHQSTPIKVCYPPPKHCTDNGLMIAYAGLERFREKMTECPLESCKVHAQWSLEEMEDTGKMQERMS